MSRFCRWGPSWGVLDLIFVRSTPGLGGEIEVLELGHICQGGDTVDKVVVVEAQDADERRDGVDARGWEVVHGRVGEDLPEVGKKGSVPVFGNLETRKEVLWTEGEAVDALALGPAPDHDPEREKVAHPKEDLGHVDCGCCHQVYWNVCVCVYEEVMRLKRMKR